MNERPPVDPTQQILDSLKLAPEHAERVDVMANDGIEVLKVQAAGSPGRFVILYPDNFSDTKREGLVEQWSNSPLGGTLKAVFVAKPKGFTWEPEPED